MKKKLLLFIVPLIAVIVFIGFLVYFNTGLRAFEKEVAGIPLPENIEVIATKSGIGDSGGNGDHSTYRVVLAVKTKMSMEELKEELKNRNLTLPRQDVNSNNPICYITGCEGSVFRSSRNFYLEFDELEKVKDFNGYYFLEFIK